MDDLLKSTKCLDYLEGLAIKICENGIVIDNSVCPGAVKEMGDILVPALANSLLSAEYMCSEILGECTSPTY